jgi:hypothetical protein
MGQKIGDNAKKTYNEETCGMKTENLQRRRKQYKVKEKQR